MVIAKSFLSKSTSRCMPILYSSFFVFSVLHSWGQSEPDAAGEATVRPPAPPGPLIVQPPAFADWTVTYQYASERAKKDPATPPTLAVSPNQVRTCHIVKTGQVLSQKTVTVGGQTYEEWRRGSADYIMPPGNPQWFQNASVTGSGSSPSIGFNDVGWITSDSYVGSITYKGHNCIVCVPVNAGPMNLTDAAVQSEKIDALQTVAFIDAQSHLPVELRISGEIRSFQFAPPPSQTQSLPEDLQKAIRQGEEGMARGDQAAPKPY